MVDNYDALLKLLDLPSHHIDLVVLNDDLLNNRVKNSVDALKYKSVFQFEELTLNFNFACSLNTDEKIIDKLTNAMKVLEKRGVFFGIREKWKQSMVSLISE